jgi:disulfide bond formation protein DsbB
MNRLFYLIRTIFFVFAVGLTACGGNGAERLPQEGESSAGQAGEAAASTFAGDPVAGKEKFVSSCSACHGPEGQGVEGLGKDMRSSQFITERSDQELIEFIKAGRDPSDPLNTTGVGMPAKGGNPALTDEDLFDIVAYIRSLRQD